MRSIRGITDFHLPNETNLKDYLQFFFFSFYISYTTKIYTVFFNTISLKAQVKFLPWDSIIWGGTVLTLCLYGLYGMFHLILVILSKAHVNFIFYGKVPLIEMDLYKLPKLPCFNTIYVMYPEALLSYLSKVVSHMYNAVTTNMYGVVPSIYTLILYIFNVVISNVYGVITSLYGLIISVYGVISNPYTIMVIFISICLVLLIVLIIRGEAINKYLHTWHVLFFLWSWLNIINIHSILYVEFILMCGY